MLRTAQGALIFCALTCPTALPSAGPAADKELVLLQDGFDDRRDAMLRLLAGKPLRVAEKVPPIRPGRGAFTRQYSYRSWASP